MIDFEYHAPTSLDQVFDLLEQYGDDSRVMAGGTALVIQMKQRLSQPGHVIGMRRVGGLNSIESTPEGLMIGALCTQRQIENSELVAKELPLIADTFRKVATPRIRNMATIGGGLVNGDPNQDPPPSLIALGASAVMTSKSGERVVPLEEFFIDYYETDVQPGEILTSVLVPPCPRQLRFGLPEVPAPHRRRLRHRQCGIGSLQRARRNMQRRPHRPGSGGCHAHQGHKRRRRPAREAADRREHPGRGGAGQRRR